MSYVQLVDFKNTTPDRKAVLEQINGVFGVVPNMFKAVANSPAALNSMWGAFGALGKGTLGAKLGEQIAVAIANFNQCEYCLAAHTVLGKGAGATQTEMDSAKDGVSADPKTSAALEFALSVVKNRAQVSSGDLDKLRAAGFKDEQVVEILAHVALNVFTNYINVALDIPVDFPKVALSARS